MNWDKYIQRQTLCNLTDAANVIYWPLTCLNTPVLKNMGRMLVDNVGTVTQQMTSLNTYVPQALWICSCGISGGVLTCMTKDPSLACAARGTVLKILQQSRARGQTSFSSALGPCCSKERTRRLKLSSRRHWRNWVPSWKNGVQLSMARCNLIHPIVKQQGMHNVAWSYCAEHIVHANTTDAVLHVVCGMHK